MMKKTAKKTIKSEIVLAGDVGGTNTRLGLFEVTRSRLHLLLEKTFLNKKYKGLENILTDFLKGQKGIAAACFGVARPITQEVVIATNLPWWIDIESVQKLLPFKKVEVMNDLVANAYGISALKKNDFEMLSVGRIKKGNQALISAGTGLGEAILFWDGKQYVPSPSEGGHAEFGPRNHLESELFHYLSDRFDHVSYERVLSGEGLFNIYQFLKDSKRFGSEPPWIFEKMKSEDPAAVISEVARLKKNKLCMKSLDLLLTSNVGEAGGFVRTRPELPAPDLELLDRLEDRVDLRVTAIREARAENDTLRGEAADLERRIEALSRDLGKKSSSHAEAASLRSRCTDLEHKLEKVRRRIEALPALRVGTDAHQPGHRAGVASDDDLTFYAKESLGLRPALAQVPNAERLHARSITCFTQWRCPPAGRAWAVSTVLVPAARGPCRIHGRSRSSPHTRLNEAGRFGRGGGAGHR